MIDIFANSGVRGDSGRIREDNPRGIDAEARVCREEVDGAAVLRVLVLREPDDQL